MTTPNEVRQRWTQMTPEEFALIKKEDLRKEVLGLYDIELNRRQALGQYDVQMPADPFPESIPMASLSDRLYGKLLDSVVTIGIFLLVIFLASILSTYTDQYDGFVVTLALGLPFIHGLIADGLGKGQSFGKKIVKTTVVDASTHMPCSFWKSIIRNVTLQLLGIIDVIFIFGGTRQRLGDKVAKTIVLKIGSNWISS